MQRELVGLLNEQRRKRPQTEEREKEEEEEEEEEAGRSSEQFGGLSSGHFQMPYDIVRDGEWRHC